MPAAPGYDALVFDMDGTLVEYTPSDHRREAAVGAFETVGIEPTETVLSTVTEGSTERARGVCRDHGVDPAAFYEEFDPALADLELDHVADGGKQPFEDALAALEALGAGDGGPSVAVLSNNYQPVVERVVERHFPAEVAVARGVTPGPEGRERRKPDTGHLEAIIDRLDADRDRTLVVGDGHSDVAVAARAGVDSVHVERRGPHDGDHEPTHRVEALHPLPEIVRP